MKAKELIEKLKPYEDFDLDAAMKKMDFKINKPVRLIELFAGFGSQSVALRDLDTDFEHYRVVESDKFAIKSYNSIHDTDFKTMDICNVKGTDLGICNTDKFCYMMTYSFPCQDLSVAGKGKGMAKNSGTRSGLLWEVERLLNECDELPQVLLMENVVQVHGKKNMPDFQKWINFLESKGYSNHWQDLNAKNYCVLQNRNRCFMVSILGKWNYKFPQPIPLERKLKDYLEDEVDEKYYINTEKAQKLIQEFMGNGTLKDGIWYLNGKKIDKYADIAKSLCARDHKGFSCSFQTQNAVIEKIPVDLSVKNPQEKTVSNCITSKDYSISKKQSLGNGVIVAMRGRNPDNPSDRTAGNPTKQRLEPNSQGICNTLTSVRKDNMLLEPVCRIRKLTPKEYWRLMDFSDRDFYKAAAVNSNTQLYKQAGNSICRNVLVAIFGQMIDGKENHYKEKEEI